jgi:flagellar hook-length control protein FliK
MKAVPKTPIAPKKTSAPKDGKDFNDALKDAQPKRAGKPEETQAKPAAKKPTKPAKAKKADKPAEPEHVEEKPADESVAEHAATGVDETDQTDAAVEKANDVTANKCEKAAEKKDATDDAANAVNLAVNQQPVTKSSDSPEVASTDAQGDDTATQTDVTESVAGQTAGRARSSTGAKSTGASKTQVAKKSAAKDVSDAVVDEAGDDQSIDSEQIAALANVSDEHADADADASADADAADSTSPTTATHAPAKSAPAKLEAPAAVELGAAPVQPTVKAEPQMDSQPGDGSPASPEIAVAELPPEKPDADHSATSASGGAESLLASDVQPKTQTAQAAAPARPAPPPPPPAPPEVRFAEANHPQIVTGIRGQLLPAGGTMHIRLDPPELGALQVSIHMQDGVMTASFQTSNDDATKLLSHSLAQLKHVLESQGVSVDKLHVSQAPRDQQSSNDDNRQQSGNENPQARQEQQRREIIQRMWRRLRDGGDPLDMVA